MFHCRAGRQFDRVAERDYGCESEIKNVRCECRKGTSVLFRGGNRQEAIA